MSHAAEQVPVAIPGEALRVYLLGEVPFERILALQRLLAYEVAGDRSTGALVVCEHLPGVSVGRHGGADAVHLELRSVEARGWPVRWVHRGGGCWLHLPGQLAVYAVLPLDRLELSLDAHLQCLANVVIRTLDDFGVTARRGADLASVVVGDRIVAGLGVAVRQWVSTFGLVFNLHPDLTAYRELTGGAGDPGPGSRPTSLERERRGPVRPALARERLLEHFGTVFPHSRTSFHFSFPRLGLSRQR